VWERRELLEFTDMSEASHAIVSQCNRKARAVTKDETLEHRSTPLPHGGEKEPEIK
jgi:hypothetical protein